MEETKAKTWKVTRCESFEDMRKVAIANWQRQSGAARRQAAWDLVVEAWKMQKRDPDELRLQRPIKVRVVHKA
jgi:hypothetical protein